LDEAALLRRTVHAEVPPKVEYDLTELGRSFLEPVTALGRWAIAHPDEFAAVRSNRRKAWRRK
jgi:DNA-binding HxlR family transcriptional regulator